ncbi:MAG: preprotein translocase subunit YajC [Flavobacteriales bacterium]|nr:preprotein translocase subunit YajC [Flavobacteriales bacterium]
MDIVLLQGNAAGGGGGFSMMVMLGAMFLVMYFFMIRPQMKKNKLQQAYREELKKGYKVITSGGIHGKISEIKETTFIIEVEDGGKLRIDKSAVSMEASMALNGEKPTK